MRFSILILSLFPCVLLANPESLPLLMRDHLTYLGAFSLPKNTNGVSDFGFGGGSITVVPGVNGETHLMVGGRAQTGSTSARVSIPSTFSITSNWSGLPKAEFRSQFYNVVDGDVSALAGITTSDKGSVSGLIYYGGRLVVSATEWYGCSQTKSHGFSGVDLSIVGDFAGFYRVHSQANVRATSGSMAHVPPEWAGLFGGPVMSGTWAKPVISCNSQGPAATVFNPNHLGVLDSIPAKTVLYYGGGNALCVGASCLAPDILNSQNDYFNMTTKAAGLAFINGTRSVLFFGTHGTGPYCYGDNADCPSPDPANNDKGPHAFPYRYQVWAYDAVDLLKVKDGILPAHGPKPYAIWTLPELDYIRGVGHAKMICATFDPQSRRIYISVGYNEDPRIEVFSVAEISPSTPSTPPSKKTINVDRSIHFKAIGG